MRLATVRTPRGTRAAVMSDDSLTLLDAPDVGNLLAMGDPDDLRSPLGERIDAESAELAQPVLAPSKIVCLGLNYEPHARETGRELPRYPTLFSKFARALAGPRDPIRLPANVSQADWEAELAFVIGRTTRDATEAEAAAAIAGYTVLNDVSMRDWQRRTPQWLQGKTFEATTPVGPVLVTPDEVDGAADLRISCRIDDEVVQEGSTADLLFSPSEIVSYLSSIVTLDPGDLVSTGTPSGVGVARDPQRFLSPGQVMITSIEGIGDLVNEIRGP